MPTRHFIMLCLVLTLAACKSAPPFNPEVETPFGLNWGVRYQDMLKTTDLAISAAPSGLMQGVLPELPKEPSGMPTVDSPQLFFTDTQGMVQLMLTKSFDSDDEGDQKKTYDKLKKVMERYYGPAIAVSDAQAEWKKQQVSAQLQRFKIDVPSDETKSHRVVKLMLTGPAYASAQQILQQYQNSLRPAKIKIE